MSDNGRIHLDFSADGFPGQWADLADLGLKSPKQFARLRQIAGEDPASLSEKEQAEAGRQFLAAVISAWHVLSPETGEALPAPADVDPSDIPMRVSKRINENVQEQIENLVPKGWKRS